jgi:serine-type D-Ala-D-Ala carboxypeptidase/endopeptidase (penicillin-binding protein 4)
VTNATARLLTVFLALVALATTVVADVAAAPLSSRLQRALTVPGVAWRSTGVLALDLETGQVVYGRNADVSLRPASNEKLPVALAALDRFGPQYRIATRVFGEGELDGAVWRGRIILKGYGDPTLGRDDLAVLAREIEATGIRRVTGGVAADESYFDTRRTAPGWRTSFYKEECPPLSALVVDEARVAGRVVDDPAIAAARAFRSALVAEGIRVARGVVHDRAAASAVQLADVFSPQTSQLVHEMNRRSDNFVAEMLLKGLGAREAGRGTTAAGAAVVRAELAERGVPLAGVRIVDGSGLSLDDRLTARAVVSLLASAWADTRVSRPFFRSLPLAGVSGTLEDRMRGGPAFGRVRAKTGTTRNASALSGFVRTRYVFSILQNGSPIPYWHARRGQDRFAQILAGA